MLARGGLMPTTRPDDGGQCLRATTRSRRSVVCDLGGIEGGLGHLVTTRKVESTRKVGACSSAQRVREVGAEQDLDGGPGAENVLLFKERREVGQLAGSGSYSSRSAVGSACGGSRGGGGWCGRCGVWCYTYKCAHGFSRER